MSDSIVLNCQNLMLLFHITRFLVKDIPRFGVTLNCSSDSVEDFKRGILPLSVNGFLVSLEMTNYNRYKSLK